MSGLPQKGLPRERLFERLESFREHDVDWRAGRTFAHVYDAGREAEEVGKEAYMRFLTENALDPTAFPSAQRLESEIIDIAVRHLHGGDRSTGNFTSGGTESIMLAVKAAREHARSTRPEIENPEIVLPVTGHAAFHKASLYLGLKVVTVDVDAQTFRADVEAMRRAVTPNTILMVGSSPSWAHGVIDPIAELAAVADEAGVLFHVDGCVGGFLLPYFRRLGAPVPEFDFRVPGVTSISMDLHKYAFAPKGASLVMYRDKSLRRHQIFGCAEWPGYTVVNPTVQSSKSEGPLAGAWAVLNFLGDDGYLEMARRLLDGARRLTAGIGRIDGLELLGRPDFSVAAAKSDGVNVFQIADEMKARGWEMQPQFAFGNSPPNIHFLLTPVNAGNVDAMLADLEEAVEAARRNKSEDLGAAVGDLVAGLDAGKLDEASFGQLLSVAGIDGVRLPERMAEVNEMLNALPAELRGELVVEFLNELFMPPRES